MAVQRRPKRLTGEDGMDEVERGDDGRSHSLTLTWFAEGEEINHPVVGVAILSGCFAGIFSRAQEG